MNEFLTQLKDPAIVTKRELLLGTVAVLMTGVVIGMHSARPKHPPVPPCPPHGRGPHHAHGPCDRGQEPPHGRRTEPGSGSRPIKGDFSEDEPLEF